MPDVYDAFKIRIQCIIVLLISDPVQNFLDVILDQALALEDLDEPLIEAIGSQFGATAMLEVHMDNLSHHRALQDKATPSAKPTI
jgi:hypothetical protein